MATCPACGHTNPEEARFCMGCATPLGGRPRPLGEERKIVTALFCDLVGFTAASESADPEDVDRVLTAYATMARRSIEAFGGLVEKFIGDAVVGVFGVPAAHEDDPERAVRAGLRIVEAAEGLTSMGGEPLRVRVGINTGEAFVRLGVAPGSGEGFFVGDAINTASRLQSVAPEMGVAVGEATYRATAVVFDYEELEPTALKGKSKPTRRFIARAAKARHGSDAMHAYDTPYVGREVELAALKAMFDEMLATGSCRFVMVVGEPGIGKSRIVAELARHLDSTPEIIAWRQGRCLPYGDGITFWALGEVLKSHAGILESDDAATATRKLDVVIPSGPERQWFRQRLLPLLGIEGSSAAERDELFTAWRRFVEHVAEERPLVLVFEDLHWADPAMLAFLEHLAESANGIPLLIVGTARPELFEARPDFTSGLSNVRRIDLAALTSQETSRLVSSLLDAAVVPAEIQATILERSGGNPLYAEEFVRLLHDRELLIRRGSSLKLRPGAEIPFPDSVQALISARLDSLAPDRKAMLADAAVVGKVFWAGAVAQMRGVPENEVVEAMRELARKELIRSSRRTSMENESEYAFWHVLARDVAYAQIPRASRASRHVAVATWIESKAPDRLEDHADILAHHYTSAADLARASGEAEQATQLEDTALRFLTLSGERALGLDTEAALEAFERAVALAPDGHPARADALRRFGKVAYQAARFSESAAALEEAVGLFKARGDTIAAADALGWLVSPLEVLSDPRRFGMYEEAKTMLETLPPGRPLVKALADAAGDAILVKGDLAEGRALADNALALADQLGMRPVPRALGFRAMARCSEGDPGGLQDFRDAIELAVEAGDGQDASTFYNNLGVTLLDYEGPRAALAVLRDGLRFAEARGLKRVALGMSTSMLDPLMFAGEFDEALRSASALAERAESAQDEGDLAWVFGVRTIAATTCGRAGETAPYVERLEALTRRAGRPDFLVLGFGGAALAQAALGRTERAERLLEQVEADHGIDDGDALAWYLPMLVRTALSIGAMHLAERLTARLRPRFPFAEHSRSSADAALVEARGHPVTAADEYDAAATAWHGLGVVPEEGLALLGRGRCLLQLSDLPASIAVLRRAGDVFRMCDMRPALEHADRLIASAMALKA